MKGNISSRFCSNSEADASELLHNLEEMFPRYLYINEWAMDKCNNFAMNPPPPSLKG